VTHPKPTDEQIGLTLQAVHRIATHDPDGWWLLADLIGIYDWLLAEIHASEHGRGFGHGTSDVHVLSTTATDLEGRLHDPLLREQRRVKRRMLADMRHMSHRWHDHAANITHFAEPWTG
jgi:hypothetical protein